jgi:hypothetical protein
MDVVDSETEDTMFKHLSICAAAVAFVIGSAHAQQEASLRRVEIPGAAFDIVIASPKPQGVRFDLGRSPDALLLHLIGGKLALEFDSAENMLKALDTLRQPVGSFNAEGRDGRPHEPVALYIVPKVE